MRPAQSLQSLCHSSTTLAGCPAHRMLAVPAGKLWPRLGVEVIAHAPRDRTGSPAASPSREGHQSNSRLCSHNTLIFKAITPAEGAQPRSARASGTVHGGHRLPSMGGLGDRQRPASATGRHRGISPAAIMAVGYEMPRATAVYAQRFWHTARRSPASRVPSCALSCTGRTAPDGKRSGDRTYGSMGS
jgi:hypothetical protein